MKLFLVLGAVLCALLTTGCQDLTISKGPDNVITGRLKSFCRKSSVDEIGVTTNGVWRVKGYNNDEVTVPLATLQALQALAAKGAGLP